MFNDNTLKIWQQWKKGARVERVALHGWTIVEAYTHRHAVHIHTNGNYNCTYIDRQLSSYVLKHKKETVR